MDYVLHFGPEAIQIDMEGDFTFYDTHSFHRMMGVIKSNKYRKRVHLNFSNLKSMDSTALRLLMIAHDTAKRIHCTLVFAGAQGLVLSKLSEAAQFNVLTMQS